MKKKSVVELFLTGSILIGIIFAIVAFVLVPQLASMQAEGSHHSENEEIAKRVSELLLRPSAQRTIGILDADKHVDTAPLATLAGEPYEKVKSMLAIDQKDFTIRIEAAGKPVYFAGNGPGSGRTFIGWSAEVLSGGSSNGGYNYEAFRQFLLNSAENIAELHVPVVLASGGRATLFVTIFDAVRDADDDGLPDALEVMFNLDPSDPNGDNGFNGDPDHDGLTNGEEILIWGTNPWNPNTDNDFDPVTCEVLNDGLEASMNLAGNPNWDPTDNEKPYPLSLTDMNMNGIPDCWETKYGITDPYGDADGDGVTNIVEYNFGTDPTNANTYGGVLNVNSDFQFILLNPAGTSFSGGSGGESQCSEASNGANVPANAGHANDPDFPTSSAGLCEKVCDAGGSCTPPTQAGESGPDCDKRPGTCSSDCCACEADYGPKCPNGCKEEGEECDIPGPGCPNPGDLCVNCKCIPPGGPLPDN